MPRHKDDPMDIESLDWATSTLTGQASSQNLFGPIHAESKGPRASSNQCSAAAFAVSCDAKEGFAQPDLEDAALDPE